MGIRSFLFGSGKVRCEFKDSKGRSGSLKIPYEGAPNEQEILKHIRALYAVEYGATLTELKIVAWMHQ